MRKNISYCHPSFSLENVKGSSNYKIIKSGRSLDLAYQLGAMTIIGLFSFNAQAECTPTPDCASIGYTETSCETISLKCPFDQTKLYCFPCDSSYQYTCTANNEYGDGESCKGKYKSCCNTDCVVGAIYYSDKTCSSCLDNSKTPVGVVVKDNELVMSNRTGDIQWGRYGTDISTLTNYSSTSDVKTDFNGKDNTAKIVAHFGEDVDATKHAGVLCYKYSTEGTNVGDWYLPAVGELDSYVYGNYSKLYDTWVSKLAWTTSFSYYFWSSSENSNYYAWSVYSDYDNVYPNSKNRNYSVTCFLDITR